MSDTQAKLKTVQNDIIKSGGSLQDYIRLFDEIKYSRNTGTEANTGNHSSKHIMIINNALAQQEANFNKQKKLLEGQAPSQGGKTATDQDRKKQIKDTDIKKALRNNKGGSVTKNRKGANDYRKGGYVLNTTDNRKVKRNGK